MSTMGTIDWTHARGGRTLSGMKGPATSPGSPTMKGRAVAFWAVTVPVCLAFALSGIANLAHVSHVARDMARLGYPAYVMDVLGVWKVLGAMLVAVPGFRRAKEWAYAGMTFDVTGAAVSRAVVGDGLAGVLPPLVVASLVVASWALRSEDRTLGSRRGAGELPRVGAARAFRPRTPPAPAAPT